ncbi:MAG: PAS domain S-box protein [Elusimicrobia bacterium]|nr:PAS domain S-box protein [Elusimicrobiota bacterium]
MEIHADEPYKSPLLLRIASLASRAVFFLAVLALAGFLFKVPVLASFFRESIPMAPSTALCFILLSGALMLRNSRSPWSGRAIYAAAVCVASVSLVVLFRRIATFGKLEVIPLWQMSPVTAALFLLAATGLLRLARDRTGPDRAALAADSTLLLLSSLILTGYLYGSPLFYGGQTIPVAFPTGAAFFALSAALLLSDPESLKTTPFFGNSVEAVLLRNFLPLTAAAVLLNGVVNLAGRSFFGGLPIINALSALAAMAAAAWLARRVALRVGGELTLAQRQRREGEARYRALVDASADGILTADLETRKFKFANPAICRMLGYTAEELTGLGVTEIHPKDALPAVIAEFEAQARGEKLLAPDIPCLRKDGTVFYADINTVRTVIDGRDCNLGMFRDSTERRKAEEGLRESEERYRSLFENMLNGFAYCRMLFDGEKPADFVYLSVNKAFETLTGLKNAAGRKVSEVIPGIREADPGLFEIYGRVARTGKPETFETYVEALKMWFSVSAYSPAKDHFVAVFDVVTARKQAEEALRKSETRLRATLEAAADGILAVDSEGKVAGANRRFAELWRIPRALLERGDDKALLDFVLEQLSDPGAFLKKVRELYDSDDESLDTLAFRDGRFFERFSLPMKLDGGRIGRVWSFRDVTAHRRAELEKERLNAELLEKNRELENFLYLTTHDLRGPLINILGFSQNLEGYAKRLREALAPAPLPAGARKTVDELAGNSIPAALGFILESSRKMDSLISALLKVSRIGRVEMKPATVDMGELAEKILASMRYQLEEAGGEIRCGDLPPCLADPDAVNRIFSNLLDNALKYRREDSPPRIELAGERREGLVVYTVADNGAGIPEKDLHGIWNLFYRHEKAGEKAGEGIGLAMVRRMAERNGGRIWVESKEGKGSVFYVGLPAAPAPPGRAI